MPPVADVERCEREPGNQASVVPVDAPAVGDHAGQQLQ